MRTKQSHSAVAVKACAEGPKLKLRCLEHAQERGEGINTHVQRSSSKNCTLEGSARGKREHLVFCVQQLRENAVFSYDAKELQAQR